MSASSGPRVSRLGLRSGKTFQPIQFESDDDLSSSPLSPPIDETDPQQQIPAPLSRLPALLSFLPLTRSQIAALPPKSQVRARASSLPPISSDGPEMSSPIRGTTEERLQTIRKKSQRKRAVTMVETRAENLQLEDETKHAILDGILQTLATNGLSLANLLFHVFDPIYKRGETQWSFFQKPGNAQRLLDLWVSMKNSDTGREEVHGWAVSYIMRVVKGEAAMITKSGELQSLKKPVDAKYVMSFDMQRLHGFLADKASVAVRIFNSFATSTRNTRSSTDGRTTKHNMVRFPCISNHTRLM